MNPPLPAVPVAPGSSIDHRAIALELQKSDLFRTYQKAFEMAAGLPLVLRLPGSFQPPLHGSKHVNGFCARMIATSKTCAACLRCQSQVEAGADKAPFTVTCPAGLAESAVPIRLGDVVIGYLQTGQVKVTATADAPPRRFSPPAGVAAGAKRELRASWSEVRTVPAERYQGDLQLLTDFAHHLGTIAVQIARQQAQAEDPVATKAREYIAAHHTEPISLAEAAAAVGMSPFYFCKVFKRLFGESFIAYLSRVRVRRACDLLQAEETRICDAAFAAGFQSLSQFNRTFRQLIGETPRRYRGKFWADAPPQPRRRTHVGLGLNMLSESQALRGAVPAEA